MSLAETAVLAVELKLSGAQQFKAGISEADAAAAGLNSTFKSSGNILGGAASNLSLVKQAAVSTGQAISGMASHFKNVITGPLGLIGLGAGLFTVAGAIHEGIDEAQSFGLEVQKLAALTGQSVEATSAMAAALDHFGVSGDAAVKTVGMLTKNIGNIVNSKAGLAGFAKTFGLSLTDAKGNLVSVNEEILRTADYFNNKSIPATEKAAGLAKLYGRSWQQLIPFLEAGRKGITEAEAAAKDLGLTLTAQNLGDLKTYRENFLTLGDATKGLQLQIGLVLIPLLSDLAKGFTGFLRNGGREQIVTFFKNMADNARTLGNVISTQVIPTISGLASTAKSFWGSIPAPLRDLLFKGIVADRTIHFLFGVSPIKLVGGLLGDIAGPIIKTLVANRLVPQPVIVTNPGFGIPGGSPTGPGSVIEDVGKGGIVSVLGSIVSSVVSLALPIIAVTAGTAAGQAAAEQVNKDKGTNFQMPGGFLDLPTEFSNLVQAIQVLTGNGPKPAVVPRDMGTGSAGDVENRRGKIGDALSNAELVKTLPKHITALQHALVGATGKNATHIAGEIKAEKAALKKAIDALKPKVLPAKQQANSLTTGPEVMGTPAPTLSNSLTRGLERLASGTFVSSVKLDATQITDLRTAASKESNSLSTGFEKLGTKVNTTSTAMKLAGTTTARATTSAGAGIVSAIRSNRPITNVTVNVSATTVQQKTTVVTRYGPTGGDRNTAPFSDHNR